MSEMAILQQPVCLTLVSSNVAAARVFLVGTREAALSGLQQMT